MGTVLALDPEVELERLFRDYVHRHFAQREEYQEAIMARRLQQEFKRAAVTGYRPGQLGDDVYKFRMPFVRGDFDKVDGVRAIKPLNLAQADTTKIIDHGDLWNKRVERLLCLNVRPDNLLFPVRIPDHAKRGGVAREICEDLQQKGVRVVPYGQRTEILEFAQAGNR